MRQRAVPLLMSVVVAVAACGGDESADPTTTAVRSTTTDAVEPTTPGDDGDLAVVAGQPFPSARCEANREAGTITYLTGFDFAAAASIVEVVLAESEGYFDELCLDVELRAGGSSTNYPLIAGDQAQFASGGSFSEVVTFAAANEARLVAVAVEGRSAIDRLILKPGGPTTLEGLAGETIGTKLGLPSSIAAMLATAGLVEGEDYDTVPLDGFDPLVHYETDGIVGFPGWASNEPGQLERDGFDPLVHYETDGIVGFPGWASNEPGQLERAGLEFELLDPGDFEIPGSFGVLYTTQQFIDEHPTAAEDFVRAAMRGLAEAIDAPEVAAARVFEFADAQGNPNFFSLEGETFRWTTDAASIAAATPEGTGVGVPDGDLLRAEVTAYAEVGLFGGEVPDISAQYDDELITAVYDDNAQVIWPA